MIKQKNCGDDFGASNDPVMAALQNGLCVEIGMPLQNPKFRAPLKKLVPEEQIGLFGEGGRSIEAIRDEVKHAVTKQTEKKAQLRSAKQEEKTTIAEMADGKEYTVKVKVSVPPVDEKIVDNLYQVSERSERASRKTSLLAR